MQHTLDGEAAVRRALGFWLLVIAGMVFAMVVLGGITRLTELGCRWSSGGRLPVGCRR